MITVDLNLGVINQGDEKIIEATKAKAVIIITVLRQ
jgi:hypothetical protein